MERFRDRHQAGELLGRVLMPYAGRDDVVVLGLPRGGIPVAYEVARQLDAPLDVLVVRKLGVPGQEELAMGAIASGGIQVLDRYILEQLGISTDAVRSAIARATAELARRERMFRGDREPVDVRGRTVILVDDGLATGSTMAAAIEALRTRDPARSVVAVPVGSPEVCEGFRARVDEVVCLMTPRWMRAVGLWYEDFEQTSDAEVRELLDQANALRKPAAPHAPQAPA
jgi:putative phosphoribosyl transferase